MRAYAYQCGPVLPGAQGSHHPFWPWISVHQWDLPQGSGKVWHSWPWISVHQWDLPQGSSKVWHSPEHEQHRRTLPWQCPLREHVGSDEGRTHLWEAWHRKNDSRGTENPHLEIFHRLLEQQEDMLFQWWASSYGQAAEILWSSGYCCLGIDILAKKVSTNIDNIIMRKLDTLVADFPDAYKLTGQDEVSKTYSFPKSFVSYRKPRAISTEQRERARQMMIAKNKAKGD